LAESLALLSESEREKAIKGLTQQEARTLLYDWDFWARPAQKSPPGEWHCWLILAGRGWGKNRTGAEWIIASAKSGLYSNMALIAETAADARDVMVEGESGILSISPPWFRPDYEPSKRRLTWPNGVQAHTYSGDDPDQLRGPQHDRAWADECAKWQYAQDAWDMMEFGLRVGPDPRVVATTTPRPIPLIRKLLVDPKTVVSRGSTYENAANLAPAFLHRVQTQYEGTRLARQELHAEVLEDVEGALWTREIIERNRVREAPPLVRVVVAIDPAVTAGEHADQTGIVCAGIGQDGHGYVLDAVGVRLSPDGWARKAIGYYETRGADRLVAEVNNGGDLVQMVIRTVDPSVSYQAVHASRGKMTRAEPVAALDEQGRIHHVGMFAELEDQMCTYVPGTAQSPDIMDARVWGITELMLKKKQSYMGGSATASREAY
jgi:phage terminase large subunit-like protein